MNPKTRLFLFVAMIILDITIAVALNIKCPSPAVEAFAGGQIFMGIYFEIFKHKP